VVTDVQLTQRNRGISVILYSDDCCRRSDDDCCWRM